MNWDDLRYLLATVQVGSLSAAARTLGVTHTTVSRRLDALEEALGARLLARRPDGVTPTELGLAVLGDVEAILDRALAIERRVRGETQTLSGEVTLATNVVLHEGWLVHHLADFSRHFPDVTLDVLIDVHRANLVRGGADLALRLAAVGQDPATSSLVARRIGTFGFGLYGRVDGPLPREGSVDLSGLRVLEYDDHAPSRPGSEWLDGIRGSATTPLRTNHAPTMMAMVRAGLGVGMVPCLVADADEALVRIGPVVEHAAVWLVIHPELRDNAAVRAVWSFLLERAEADAHLFAGAPRP